MQIEERFLFSAHRLMMPNICTKFHGNTKNSLQILNGLKNYRANTVSIPIIIKGHISVKLQVEYSIDAFHFDLVS